MVGVGRLVEIEEESLCNTNTLEKVMQHKCIGEVTQIEETREKKCSGSQTKRNLNVVKATSFITDSTQ